MKKLSALLACISLLDALVHNARCFEHTDDTVDFHGPDVRPGYPDLFHLHFVLPKDTLSPNGKYGVIFPDRTLGEMENDSLHNYVVSFDPSQILTELDTASPEFEGKSHGGYEVEWSGDSSVALITLEAKWGPGEFFLIELQEGKVSRTTNLDKKIRQLIEPEYRKAHAASSDDSSDFIYEYQDSETRFCKLEKLNDQTSYAHSPVYTRFLTTSYKGQLLEINFTTNLTTEPELKEEIDRIMESVRLEE
jgi:hypothetical protein